MKLGACVIAFGLAIVTMSWEQSGADNKSATDGGLYEARVSYSVQGATVKQEALLREAIQAMQPAVLPSRIVVEPHWKYLYATKIFRLHVPSGMASRMFTHLASRSIFIDADRCWSDECLLHCLAHELGHLERNSVSESDAEKTAARYRRNLRDAAHSRPDKRTADRLASQHEPFCQH